MVSKDDIDKVIQLIRDNPVIGVTSPTGTGKSTILARGIRDALRGRVILTEPTISACSELAGYMKKYGHVGYATGEIKKITSTDTLVYMTRGYVRKKILSLFAEKDINKVKLDFCQVLIIDEAHDGSLDVDVIASIWKMAWLIGLPVPRLVLMSANLSMDATIFPNAPGYQIIAKTYPVTINYHSADFKPTDRKIYQEAAKVVQKLHQERPMGVSLETWIVFCPGLEEVEMVASLLKNTAGLSIFIAHSGLSIEEVDYIFQPAAQGHRKVVIATNIAETSVTINHLVGVIDTMLEKYPGTTAAGGLTLELHCISQDSANQRSGRTGRTQPGFVYRLCTQEGFSSLPLRRPVELTRVPIETVYLEIIGSHLQPNKVFEERLDSNRVAMTAKTLTTLGMIDSTGVTETGKLAASLPLNVRCGALVNQWLETPIGKRFPFPVIVIVCLIESGTLSYCYYSPQESDEEQVERYQKYFIGWDSDVDIAGLLEMWRQIMAQTGQILVPTKKLIPICTKMSLNHRRVSELLSNVHRCVLRLEQHLHRQIDIGDFHTKTVLDVMNPIIQKVYADRLLRLIKGRYVDLTTRKSYRLVKWNHPYKDKQTSTKETIYALSMISTSGNLGRIGLSHWVGESFSSIH